MNYPVLKIYLGAIRWGSQTNMLGRALDTWTSGFPVGLLMPPQRTPTLPKHHLAQRKPLLQLASPPGTQAHFIFLRSIACFAVLPADLSDTSNELSHHLVVIAIMKLSTNAKNSTKMRALIV